LGFHEITGDITGRTSDTPLRRPKGSVSGSLRFLSIYGKTVHNSSAEESEVPDTRGASLFQVRTTPRIHARFRSLSYLFSRIGQRGEAPRNKESIMVTDPIGDMLVRIRNAGAAKKPTVVIPYSDIKIRIANVLLAQGYIAGVVKKAKKGDVTARWIDITLAYDDAGFPRISGAERVSKPSRRVYRGASDLHSVRQGLGVAIISTPKGIMTDFTARKEHVGGEVLCRVW
jgi:small subunit ribosomal protein S8